MRGALVGLVAATSLAVMPGVSHAATSYVHFKDSTCGYSLDYPSSWAKKKISGGYLFDDSSTNMVLTSQCAARSDAALDTYFHSYWQRKNFKMDPTKRMTAGSLVSGSGKIGGQAYDVEVIVFKKSARSSDAFQFLVPVKHLKALQGSINHIIDSIQL